MPVLSLKPPSPNAALLEEIARDQLRQAGSPQAALVSFVEEIRDAGGLLNELVDDAWLEARALAFLEKIAVEGGSPKP